LATDCLYPLPVFAKDRQKYYRPNIPDQEEFEMTYVARRKTAKNRGKHDQQGQKDQHQHDKNADATRSIDEANQPNFVNEQRIKELAQRRGPHGLDLDGIR